MKIQSMFRDDINRKINGVVKVNQADSSVLAQELDEYVITDELKRHLAKFLSDYVATFERGSDEIGVWISGFFGSGKSHFLKMLSYLLKNEIVCDIPTVERFRAKASDPATFALIERAVANPTDTILFNIDVEGSINKDNTAVLRVFAKMFYNYLGFYGENLKVAQLEQFIDRRGKTSEFRRVFEEKSGSSWLSSRDAYAFLQDDIVATLTEVLGMSAKAASDWFNGAENVETSIARVVAEIKAYVDARPENFRLLFMIDEVGQYVGGDTNLLMNLQSLVEELGSKCRGKVWVICTGQEALDEIIKARENEFSRIQARFKTRLSLSSASADEVIQKRILQKTDAAALKLREIYAANEFVLRNLFTFSDAVADIKGYADADEFTKNFPFVPYQFILLQKVFAQIRRHGNAGTHLSGGERSMLSGFQEAAQKIQDRDEYALTPFYLFYDTVHAFLDSSIRLVIDRCERAARDGNGIETQDVDVLKLLYFVRYVDDVKANLDNIVILMADDMRTDKINMRKKISDSLDRLTAQNYIGRTEDIYAFLTDEEQDIRREINAMPVTSADIVARIGEIIFGEIYTTKKFRLGKYEFALERMVDGQIVGTQSGGLTLRILTAAADPADKIPLQLHSASVGQAVAVLAANHYYDALEHAMKIRKFIRRRNVAQNPQSVQNIIRSRQDAAAKFELIAADELRSAIVDGDFYVDGEKVEINGGDAKSKLDRALERLIARVYGDIGLINHFADSAADIVKILRGTQQNLSGTDPNKEAADKVDKYLEIQLSRHLPTTMSDVQEHFGKRPFGWRELDIASVVAKLIREQKVTVKYGGAPVSPDDPNLPDMLCKRSETAKTSVSKRQAAAAQIIHEVRKFLRNFFDEMNVPADEDGLFDYTVKKFSGELEHLNALLAHYDGGDYPGREKITEAVAQVKDVISQRKDNVALIRRVLERQDDLCALQDDLQTIDEFFNSKVALFDRAANFAQSLRVDEDYIAKDADAAQALEQVRLITTVPQSGQFDYGRIPHLNGLLATLQAAHDNMLTQKRAELFDIADRYAQETEAAEYYAQKKIQIAAQNSLTVLDGIARQMLQFKDDLLRETPQPQCGPFKEIYRQAVFPARTLRSTAEIDAYVEEIRAELMRRLESCDGLKLM